MFKRRKYLNNRDATITTHEYQIKHFFKYNVHNYVYYLIPFKNGNPIGKSEKIRFSNIYVPDEFRSDMSFNVGRKTQIITKIRINRTSKTVISWRFKDDLKHSIALTHQRYCLSYKYLFKGKAIDAFENYNKAIIEKTWAQKYIQTISLQNIEQDPWYLIEWEDKLKNRGISRDSRKHFGLAQCDAIGTAFHLDPLTDSRILQYCVNSMNELCHRHGGTIVYFEQYVRETIDFINQSDMNKITKCVIKSNRIREMSFDRDDYFFIGRTEMHNLKKFIASKEIWDAQETIINKLHSLVYPMNTPYYAERELLLNNVKSKYPINLAGFDVIKSILSRKLWFNSTVEEYVQHFMNTHNIINIDDIQRKSIHTSFNENVSIVSGGPGRGKSSCVLKCILFSLVQMYSIPKYNKIEENYSIDSIEVLGTKDTDTDTILDSIAHITHTKQNNEQDVMFVHVLSFTGKAVSCIKNLLKPPIIYNTFEPMTIHRLLIRCSQFKWLKHVPTTIIVDETSMISDMLFFTLLKCFTNIKKIVLLGDFDQLPPIQPGDLLYQLIQSRCFPVTRLIKNYRQGVGSGLPDIADKIIGRQITGENSTRINGGWDHALNIPVLKNKSHITDIKSVFGTSNKDCQVFGYNDDTSEEDIFENISKKIRELAEDTDNKINLFIDCIVLSAKRVEVAKLNSILQSQFIPDIKDVQLLNGTTHHWYEGIKFSFVEGDRVMYLENDYTQDMFNGDIGRVVGVEQNKLNIRLAGSTDEKIANLDDVQPSYSCTVHKSQGSEFKLVLIYISDSASLLHVDQWLYTGFTRARQKIMIFGYTKEILATVHREMKYRRTFLKHRLQLKFSHQLNDLIKDELQDVPK